MTTEVNAVRRSPWCREGKPAPAEPTLTDRFVTMMEWRITNQGSTINIPPPDPAWSIGQMAGTA